MKVTTLARTCPLLLLAACAMPATTDVSSGTGGSAGSDVGSGGTGIGGATSSGGTGASSVGTGGTGTGGAARGTGGASGESVGTDGGTGGASGGSVGTDGGTGGTTGAGGTSGGTANAFVHPGIAFSRADLDLVKTNQNSDPWRATLTALKASAAASLTYAMQGPFTAANREAGNTAGWAEAGNDAQACYIQALLWYITGNATYATNAKNIINAWSSTLRSIGGADVELLAGVQGPLWAMAGELLANSGTSSGWAAADITRAKNMLTNIFLPTMVGFDPSDGANFSDSTVFSTMAIAVFTDNRTKYTEAYNAFVSSAGCPNDYSLLKNISASGQNVESGRDQIHTMSSIEMLAGTSETAYIQGNDTYSIGSYRMMLGSEFTYGYNLGNSVTWDASVYRCRPGFGPWTAISATGRGVPNAQGAVCNMVYRAYRRINQTATYTKQMATSMGNTMVGANPRNGWGNPFMADALLYNLGTGQ